MYDDDIGRNLPVTYYQKRTERNPPPPPPKKKKKISVKGVKESDACGSLT